MMVTNRSNDIVWGCYGANAVHFSYLMEYIAAGVGVPVGKYRQVSNNLHMYDFNAHLVDGITINCEDPYFSGRAKSFPLVNTDIKTWEMDLTLFFERGPITGFRDEFFTKVVTPLWWSYVAFKKKDNPNRFDNARHIAEQCADTGWALAAKEWLNRREENAKNSK